MWNLVPCENENTHPVLVACPANQSRLSCTSFLFSSSPSASGAIPSAFIPCASACAESLTSALICASRSLRRSSVKYSFFPSLPLRAAAESRRRSWWMRVDLPAPSSPTTCRRCVDLWKKVCLGLVQFCINRVIQEDYSCYFLQHHIPFGCL